MNNGIFNMNSSTAVDTTKTKPKAKVSAVDIQHSTVTDKSHKTRKHQIEAN